MTLETLQRLTSPLWIVATLFAFVVLAVCAAWVAIRGDER